MGSWMVSYGVMMGVFEWDVDLETTSDLWRPPVPYMDYFIPSILVAFAASSWGYLPLALGLPFTDSQGGGYWDTSDGLKPGYTPKTSGYPP